MAVNTSRRVDVHAFVEVGVQVGSRLCLYGSAGRQPCGMAWCIVASTAPEQPIAAGHCGEEECTLAAAQTQKWVIYLKETRIWP